MIRIVSVAVFAALAAALFLVPGVSPARLATKQIGELVHEEADRLTAAGDPVTDANGEPVRAPLWEILVEAGQTGQPDPDAEAHPALKIGGARFVVDEEVLQEGEVRDINWSLEAVRSIQRELRAVIAEEGIPVRVDTYKKPHPDGFGLFLGVSKDALGPIEITAVGLPSGVQASSVISEPSTDKVNLVLSSGGTAFSGPIRIMGTARQPREIVRYARTPARFASSVETIWLTAVPQP